MQPKRPRPLATIANDKHPPAPVGKVEAGDRELRGHAIEMNASPRRVPGNLPLRDQPRNSHRRTVVNEPAR
jgi:hypothetical protein